MKTIESTLQVKEKKFQENSKYHQQLWKDVSELLDKIYEGGGERANAKQAKRGKLPVRQRIKQICDSGTEFLELSPIAGKDLYDVDVPAAGIVTGVGTCLLYTSPSPRDRTRSRMPSSA